MSHNTVPVRLSRRTNESLNIDHAMSPHGEYTADDSDTAELALPLNKTVVFVMLPVDIGYSPGCCSGEQSTRASGAATSPRSCISFLDFAYFR